MNKIILTTLLLIISVFAFGQETKIINSIETTLELGLGGAIYGTQVKANHHWIEKDKITVLSGLSFSTFWSGVNNYTAYYPSLAALTEIKGFTTDNHLRIYSGAKFSFFKKKKINLSVEGYFGGYNSYMNGSYFHERLQVNQKYKAGQFFADYGTRLGFGYQINDKIGLQATLINSLRQLGYGYRLAPTVYQYNPDNKMSLGIGMVWNLNEID